MTTIYILIIFLSSWNDRGGNAIDHIEFISKEACESAMSQLTIPQFQVLHTICVPKG